MTTRPELHGARRPKPPGWPVAVALAIVLVVGFWMAGLIS